MAVDGRRDPEDDPGNQEQQHVGLWLGCILGCFGPAGACLCLSATCSGVCGAKIIVPMHHQVKVTLDRVQVLHERRVSGDLTAGNRTPDAQGRVDPCGVIRGEAFGRFFFYAASGSPEDDAVDLADIRVVHIEQEVSSGPGLPAIEGRHLAGEHQAGVFLLAGLANAPACVCHCFKDVARVEVLLEFCAGFFGDALVRELLASCFDPGKVFVGALRQLFYTEKFTLAAEDIGVAILAAKPVEQVGHVIVVAFCGIETAG